MQKWGCPVSWAAMKQEEAAMPDVKDLQTAAPAQEAPAAQEAVQTDDDDTIRSTGTIDRS